MTAKKTAKKTRKDIAPAGRTSKTKSRATSRPQAAVEETRTEWCDCLSKNLSVNWDRRNPFAHLGAMSHVTIRYCARCKRANKEDLEGIRSSPSPESGPLPFTPESQSRLLARPRVPEPVVAHLRTVTLTTAETEPVKAGALRVLKGNTNFAFKPMSVECTLLVAQRFHIMSLQAHRNVGTSLRHTSQPGAPVATWTVYDPPSLLPGEEFELVVMNMNGSPHHFAATIVGASIEGA